VITHRAELIADTAIAILAERGMRGLTHRAIDEAAGLPPGSTSNHARTRAALLELTLARLTEREEASFADLLKPVPESVAEEGVLDGAPVPYGLADLMARAMHQAVTVDRRTTIARYELALEATRRPELRRIYDELGRRFREPAVAMLAAAGSSDPVRHGHQIVAFGEGILFDAVIGAGGTPSLEELKAAFRELLNGILSSPARLI
jgi:DNA-binding transcriptional regulator YbjK